MSAPREPERLASSSEVPERIQRVLQRAREDAASSADLARIRARVFPPAAPPSDGQGGGSGAGAGSALAPVIGGAIGVLVIGAAVVGLLSLSNRSLHPAIAGHAATSILVDMPVPATSSPLPDTPPSDSIASEPSATAVTQPASAQAPTPHSSPSEVELLDAARSALPRDPQAALGLAQRHRALFPKGILSQERDVIEVEALARMGRDGEARRKAQEFQERNPNSPYGSRLKNW